MLAAFEATDDGPEVVADPVGLALVLKPPVELLLDPPDEAVAVAPAPVAVALEPDPPMPVGERPEPELTIPPPLAAEDAEETALAKEEAVAELPDPEPVAVAVEDAELLEETLAQDRSNNGVELRGEPGAIPKLGLGVALLSVSSRVYHQVLTTSKLGHPTWSQ
jgi:hypothetical protein